MDVLHWEYATPLPPHPHSYLLTHHGSLNTTYTSWIRQELTECNAREFRRSLRAHWADEWQGDRVERAIINLVAGDFCVVSMHFLSVFFVAGPCCVWRTLFELLLASWLRAAQIYQCSADVCVTYESVSGYSGCWRIDKFGKIGLHQSLRRE